MSTNGQDAPVTRRRARKASPVRVLRLASSPTARAIYTVVGTVGLFAIAIGVIGPKRVRREVLEPLRDAIEPQAEKAWAEAAPLREQLATFLERAGPEARKQLARNFQSWIGHFRTE